MAEPLVTISLSDYNNLLLKKDIYQFLSDTVMLCKTLDEVKEKLETPSWGLQVGDFEIKVKFSVDIKNTNQ